MHGAPPFAAHRAPDGRAPRRWQAFYQEREMELLDATLDLRRLLAEHQSLDQRLLVGRLLGRQFLDERCLSSNSTTWSSVTAARGGSASLRSCPCDRATPYVDRGASGSMRATPSDRAAKGSAEPRAIVRATHPSVRSSQSREEGSARG